MKSIVTLSFTLVVLLAAGCQREAPEERTAQVAETPPPPVMMPPVEVTNSDFVAPSQVPQPTSGSVQGEATPALPTESATPTGPAPDGRKVGAGSAASPSASEGKRLYAEFGCATCHGANGDGRRMGLRSFAERTVQQKPDAELMRIIIEGGGPQSAGAHKSRNLGAEQAHAVVAWIRTLG